MSLTFYYTITNEQAGMTTAAYLGQLGYSKKLLIDLKKDPSYLTIDHRQVYTTHTLLAGDVLRVELPPEPAETAMAATEMPLAIVYEDDHILVINKAAGVPIHPSQGNYTGTLANGIAWYYQQQNRPFVYRVINRLDRDTTGLLILAKHALSACILSDMVKNRKIHRTYLTAVSGDIRTLNPDAGADVLPGLSRDPAAGPYAFTLAAPIARVDGSTIERRVDWTNGEYACTHFQVHAYCPGSDSSLVECKLATGRTHQIRVHMRYLGFPLFGDFLYGPDYRFIERQSLHSWKLSFIHPITKEPLAFTAAVPDDMQYFLPESALHQY